MSYIKIKPNEYLIKQFRDFKDMMSFLKSKKEKDSIWSDFPKVEWEVKVYLAKLMITAKRRTAIKTMQNKKAYEKVKLYNIN